MNIHKKLSGLGFTILFVAACVSVPPPNCVAFGHGGQVCLLQPTQLPPVDGAHMVTVERDGKRQIFIGQLHIDAHAIRLAGSSLFGPSLFIVSYDGHSLRSEPANGPQHADLLIAMLEMVTARQQMLQPALRGLVLRQTTLKNGQRLREFSEHGHVVVRIETGPGPLTGATIRFDIMPAHIAILMQPLAS
jgi:Protein of unknown function (DUF3261)